VDSRISSEDAQAAALELLAYCRANDWAGYDPYDALNSSVLTALPFLNFSLARFLLTQAVKRSPINIRRLLRTPKTQNPKALALFLAAALTLPRLDKASREDLVDLLTERIIALRSRESAYWCWGYSFPWQMRTKMVPRGAPNVVCTSFVANALLDAYEQRQESRYLSMAASAAEYMKNELYWTAGDTVAGFTYPLASMRTQVHNANLLAAAVLCRVAKHTGEKTFLGPALRVARYSAAQQNDDGSWFYGELPTARWIDNFHTGYNLCALRSIGQSVKTTEFESCLRRGFEFYRAHFFRKDGAVRYFHNRTYPIDIHSVAQSIITLLTLRDLNPENVHLAHSVLRWAMSHMRDERGFFYYRVLRLCTIRTSYMRWSQAWMLLALAAFLGESNVAVRHPQLPSPTAAA
jgi:rhamnogalacturonyl hydrolase YesR